MVCVNNVFDGVSETLLKNANALVEGNLIKVVSSGSGKAGSFAGSAPMRRKRALLAGGL